MKRVLLIVAVLVLLIFVGSFIESGILYSNNNIYGKDIIKTQYDNYSNDNEPSFIDKIASFISNFNGIKTIQTYDAETTIDKMKTIKFGSYPQTDETGNIKEPIEWLVVGEYEDKILLLSKYILDCKCYNDTASTISWGNSTLRNWLNTTFYDSAFNDDEKQNIATSSIINDLKTDKNILDYVFIPSIAEIFGSFNNDAYGQRYATKGTHYAVSKDNNGQKLWTSFGGYGWDKGNSSYWVRDIDKNKSPYTIKPNGNINFDAVSINNKTIGVRPCLFIFNNNRYKVIGKKLETYRLKTYENVGLVNAYGQEITIKNGEVIDWTNKIEGLDKDHEAHPTDDGDGGAHPYYYANLGDSKNWKIGPNGYPEPPEELRMRATLARDTKKALNGSNEIKKKMAQQLIDEAAQSYGVCYKIEGKTYCIIQNPGGRGVFLDGHDIHGKDDKIIMMVGKNDKSTNEELLALCLADQKGLLTKAAKK